MFRNHRFSPFFKLILFCALTMLLPTIATAYNQFTQDGNNTNCAACHGDFRDNNYISTVDGENWGNLHNLHRSTMLGGDCDTCHSSSGRFPVLINSSAGGSGLAAIACMGCHGRDEDNVAANPSFPNGRGAGLRQHHNNAGVAVCAGCHQDADPANYTPVGESVAPPYYANPGSGHDSMPTGACNDDGSENFAGLPIGLDNDGNSQYDGNDQACNASAVVVQSLPQARLLQNHPNPFNPITQIRYVVMAPGPVRLQVFSVDGQLVRTLVNGDHDMAMTYQVTWNGRDDGGRTVPSGVFFYRLETAGGSEMKKMLLLK